MNLGPYHLVKKIRYPPVFRAIGTEDEAFDISKVAYFDQQLKRYGVESKLIVVEGMGHSFNIKAEVSGETHASVIVPTINFAEGHVGLVRKTVDYQQSIVI